MNHKFVFDTNALISATLLRKSINAKALDHAAMIIDVPDIRALN